MASLIHPKLFSQHFGINPNLLAQADLLDPFLNADTKLFIDPLLIHKSDNANIRKNGLAAIRKGFSDIISLVDISANENDAAWKGAFKALDLGEAPETGLGYGGSSRSGSSRPASVRQTILRTIKEIITLGEKNPDMIPMMGIFEEGVGPDTISDMTTHFLFPTILQITSDFCLRHNVSVKTFGGRYTGFHLPENPFRSDEPVLLVPRDILRDLPLATDWADVSRVIMEIEALRDAVNKMFGSITKATTKQKKVAMRKIILSDVQTLRDVLSVLADASESYDEKADLDGFYLVRNVLGQNPAPYLNMVTQPASRDQSSLHATVLNIVDEFQKLVENNNMWELLWHKDQPRHERASQLLFFAVANIMCVVNNVDISPETNAGGGPVDFKFSTGFHGRVLVEMKLSKGTVEHGYKTQLEVYKKAARTSAGIFVIVQVGPMGQKLKKIQKMQADARAKGELASDIIVIDARRQKSASTR
jgi:hypothetical protein